MTSDSILSILLAALVSAGQPEALKLLQNEYAKDIYDYKALISLLMATLKHLEPLASKTASTLDDQGIADAEAILKASASANGITL